MKRWLSYRGVTEMTSLSEASIRRLVADGKFPKPQELPPAQREDGTVPARGRVVFDSEQVEAAMERLLAARREAKHSVEAA
jgi:predicted DNA-binding transcriptional regulator AlpA